jgi:hypothetical protein
MTGEQRQNAADPLVAVITGIGLSVQLGFSCWAVVTAAVVTPLHLVLRVFA